MRINLRSGIILGLGLMTVAGCAGTTNNPLTRLSLPSPWATVSASEREAAVKSKPASKKKADAESQDGQIALDMLRGRGMEQSGEHDKARKLYEGLRQQYPDNLEVVHRLGVVADAQRRHGEAEGMFLYVLQREPRNADVLADLGYCYFLQGQLTKSESALAKAVRIEPGNPRFLNNLGLVVGHQGRHEEALAHFMKAGTEADAYYNLAFVYASQEQGAKAKECFEMALNEDPTHGKSREALRSFEEFERLPAHLREDTEMLTDGRVKYVPYIEGAGDQNAVQQAGGALPTSRDASQTTRALQLQSRGMLDRNMQSQRNDSPIESIQAQ